MTDAITNLLTNIILISSILTESAIYGLIASFIEAAEYNYRKILPLNGKEKFRAGDFFLSNYIYFITSIILSAIYIRLFGVSTSYLFMLVFAIIYSVTIDKKLLKDKVDSSKLLIIPMLARITTRIVLILLLVIFLLILYAFSNAKLGIGASVAIEVISLLSIALIAIFVSYKVLDVKNKPQNKKSFVKSVVVIIIIAIILCVMIAGVTVLIDAFNKALQNFFRAAR